MPSQQIAGRKVKSSSSRRGMMLVLMLILFTAASAPSAYAQRDKIRAGYGLKERRDSALIYSLDPLIIRHILDSLGCCTGSASCPRYVAVPLVCNDTERVRIDVPRTVRLCDSACTMLSTTYRDTNIVRLYPYEMLELYYYAGDSVQCSATTTVIRHSGLMCFVYDAVTDRWIGNLKEMDPAYPFRCCPPSPPGANYCCVPVNVYRAWATYKTTLDIVTDTIPEVLRIPTDCRNTSAPGFLRTVTNCRDTTITEAAWVTRIVPRYSGRDSLVFDDSCDCLVPYFKCTDPVTHDSVEIRTRYETIRIPVDSVYCDTCRTDYVIPTSYYTLHTPAQGVRDTCVYWAIIDTLIKGQPLGEVRDPSRQQVPIWVGMQYGGGTVKWGYPCFNPCRISGDTTETYLYKWLDRTTFDLNFPCVSERCDVIVTAYDTVRGSCRSVNDTLRGRCWFLDSKGNLVPQTATWPFTRPGADSVRCDTFTVRYRDSTFVSRIDTLHYTVTTPGGYVLMWRDTCTGTGSTSCVNTITASNGTVDICNGISVRNDCPTGSQPYWDGHTLVLSYSCESGASAYDPRPAIALLQLDLARYVDSLRALRDTVAYQARQIDTLKTRIASLESKAPICDDVTIGEGGTYTVSLPSAPTHVSITYAAGWTPVSIPRYNYAGGVLTITADPTATVTYCWWP